MSLHRLAMLAMPITFVSATALASGYQLNEQDATTVGMALAGVAVEHSPAVQVTNPAGIANLPGGQAQAGTNLFLLNGHVNNNGTTSLLGTPVGGGSADLQATIMSPYAFATYQLNPRLTAGFALDTQIGLSTHYPDGWFGRYFALNSDLETLDLNPNLAFKVTDAVAVGAGIVGRYTKARLTHAIDLGGIGFANRIPGSIPEAQDGIARLDANDWGVGYKLGADWHITPSTEFGIGFRSEVETKIDGTAKFTLSPPGAVLSAVTGTLVNTPASTTVKDPATLNLSLSHAYNSALTVYADFDWVQWSAFKGLTVTYTNPLQGQTNLPGSWRDTWKAAVGGEYKVTPTVALRAGTAFESSPIRDSAHRTPLLPDGDRIWLSGGVGWQVLPNLQVNLGYAHVFVHSGGIFEVDPTAGVLRASTSGAGVDIVTGDAVVKF